MSLVHWEVYDLPSSVVLRSPLCANAEAHPETWQHQRANQRKACSVLKCLRGRLRYQDHVGRSQSRCRLHIAQLHHMSAHSILVPDWTTSAIWVCQVSSHHSQCLMHAHSPYASCASSLPGPCPQKFVHQVHGQLAHVIYFRYITYEYNTIYIYING